MGHTLNSLLTPPSDISLSDYAAFQYGKTCLLDPFAENQKEFLQSIHIGLFTILPQESDSNHFNTFRKALYELRANFRFPMICDFGNLPNTRISIEEATDFCHQHNILAIFINDSMPDLAHYQLKSYERHLDKISCSFVHSHLTEKRGPHVRLEEFQPNFFQHIELIGGQSYYIDPQQARRWEQRNSFMYRLGPLRTKIEQIEPLVRESHTLHFQLEAIEASSAPAGHFLNPNGFSGTDACKIVRYAAMSDLCKSIAISGYNATIDKSMQTARLLAQMVWFIVDGYQQRKNEYPIDPTKLKAYVVYSKNYDDNFTFYKSIKSNRWWLLGPSITLNQPRLIPCAHADYIQACEDKFPDRLFKAYERFL